MRVFLIGAGLLAEKQLINLGVPIEVVGFVEVGENFKRARHMFPQAAALEDLDKVIEQLESGEISVPDNDLLVCTLPCQNETALKSLNKYPTTKTAHLFTKSQFRFIDLVRPTRVLNEMVPPRWNYEETHNNVLSEFRERGFQTNVDMVDACMVGDYTSHHRWFCLATKHLLPQFNVLLMSGMACKPKPVRDILEKNPLPSHVGSVPESDVITNAPPLVLRLFRQWDNPLSSPELSEADNAWYSVLLAWYFGKRSQRQLLFGYSDEQPVNLDDPAICSFWAVLQSISYKSGRRCSKFKVVATSNVGSDKRAFLCFGFGKGRQHVAFKCYEVPTECVPLRAARSVVKHVNDRFPSLLCLASGGCVVVQDSSNHLRSKLRATIRFLSHLRPGLQSLSWLTPERRWSQKSLPLLSYQRNTS